MWTFCRVQIPKSSHRRRSDISSTNGIQKLSKYPLPRGFSFDVALLAWAIASGFLLQFFDTLLLSGQIKPKYSNFVNTKRDLVDLNMTLGWILKNILRRSGRIWVRTYRKNILFYEPNLQRFAKYFTDQSTKLLSMLKLNPCIASNTFTCSFTS